MKKPNTIESVLPYSGEYSFRADLRLSSWMLVAMCTFAGVEILMRHDSDLAGWSRVLLSFLPLVPFAFFVRAVKRFICGLDEMQRRVQLEVMLFAALVTLFISMVISLLNAQGVPTGDFKHGLGFAGTMMPLVILWLLGNYVTRRHSGASDEK